MNLLQMLQYYLKHQEEVVTRRTQYDLNKAEERAHIVEGLLIALDNIDEVIQLIRASKTAAEAKEKLMERFSLSEPQANSIVEMRLRALTGLEREKLENEYAELKKVIEEYRAILADRKVLLGVVKKRLLKSVTNTVMTEEHLSDMMNLTYQWKTSYQTKIRSSQ